VISGFWKKAIFALVTRKDNDDPAACFTKSGVQRAYTSFSSVTFQKNCKEKFVCFGTGKVEYYPGLKTPNSTFSID
jgi:hypothetical protein